MRLGPYELVRLIGAGGMGEVWAAYRVSVGAREVLAVKRLPERLASDPTYRRSLLDEARLSMLLEHPNIVHVFDAGEADGEAYIAMEFVHGLDLSRLRKLLDETGEQITPEVAAYVIGEVLRGLSYAHALIHEGEHSSLVHRDVSPHNVILSIGGEVKLTDFGVARLSSEDTSGTHVKGKARYMPPEQLRGDSRSPTVDLFAAGAVLQEMLDGQMFRGEAVDDARLLGMAVDGVVPDPSWELDDAPELAAVLRGLLEPDPEQRIASAEQALAMLRRWPGYRDASRPLGALVRRHLEVQNELRNQDHDLGHQDTFLHTNEAIQIDGGVIDPETHGDPDHILRGIIGEDSTSGNFGPVEDLHITADQRGPAATGGHPQLSNDAPEAPPALAIDLPQTSFVRHVATSPNPVIPPRRWGRIAAIGLGVVVLGLGIWQGAKLLAKRTPPPPPPPPREGLRDARVIGDDFAGYAGFRLRRMDKLAATHDIDYRFVSEGDDHRHPLAALAAGKAEFALTSLDQVLLEYADRDLEAGSELGKIVAIVDVSLGGDALVLDTVEYPKLRSLPDLAALARSHALEPVLALAPGTPSEYLDLHLDALLRATDSPTLSRSDAYEDVRAVYDALLADAEPRTPVVAALLWEPWVGKAAAEGMTVVASTRDLPHAIVDVLVASPTVLAKDPELAEHVVASYYAGIHDQADASEQLVAAVVRDLGLSETEAARTLAGLCMLDASGAAPWLIAPEGGTPLLQTAVEETWATLRETGRVEGEAPNLAAIADARALASAAAGEAAGGGAGSLEQCLAAIAIDAAPSQPLGELELPDGDQAWFLPGDASLTPERAAAVAELMTRLAAFNPRTVSGEVVGYGDDRGGASRRLGHDRAQAIVDAAARAGIELPLRARGAKGGGPVALLSVELERVPEN